MNIKEFLNQEDKSGRLSKEKWLMANNEEAYKTIIDYSNNNFLNDIPFKEKVYLYIHDLNNKPICKNKNCSTHTKFVNKTLGYLDYCSNKCQSSSDEIMNKRKNTNIERYGFEHAIYNKEKMDKFNSKVKNRDKEKQIEINNKRKKTNLENFGYDNPNKNPKFLEKRVQSFKENIEQWKAKYNKTINIINEIKYQKYEKNTKYINSSLKDNVKNLTFECLICNDIFEINYPLLHYRYNNNNILCTKCNDPLDNKISSFHIEVLNYIKSFYSGEIILNDRVELKGKEIDIWIPEFRIGIECNGLYWHTESFKGKNYHKDKYNISKENNINLIQIWEDEWKYKRDIVKSRLSNKLKYTSKNIYSRKCVIKNLSSKEAKDFLNKNHLQGFIASKYYLGLNYNSELVSLMSFGLLRIALNSKGDENDYEILRFCNCLNTNVIGSASKLFNHFIKENKPNSVISYASLEWGDGDFYSKLGMIDKGMTDIGYYYVIDGKREHRYKFTKHKLVADGYDSNKSEYRIMLDRGYDRVWSCGNQKWIWNK